MHTVPFRMMLGFVVRQCAADLGHPPTADELADWANNRRHPRGSFCLFGRAISAREARVILGHPERMVTVYGTFRDRFPSALPSSDPGHTIPVDLTRPRGIRRTPTTG